MTPEQLLEKTAAFCETLRVCLQRQVPQLGDFSRRLLQIIQQLRKNMEVRDVTFANDFNNYVKQLREELNQQEPVWTELRNQIRQVPDKEWTADLSLDAKGFNSRAKALSVTCDEFVDTYDKFCKQYKNFTAVKLNVWLLTSCQTDVMNVTGKMLFLARELARKTEQKKEAT